MLGAAGSRRQNRVLRVHKLLLFVNNQEDENTKMFEGEQNKSTFTGTIARATYQSNKVLNNSKLLPNKCLERPPLAQTGTPASRQTSQYGLDAGPDQSAPTISSGIFELGLLGSNHLFGGGLE